MLWYIFICPCILVVYEICGVSSTSVISAYDQVKVNEEFRARISCQDQNLGCFARIHWNITKRRNTSDGETDAVVLSGYASEFAKCRLCVLHQFEECGVYSLAVKIVSPDRDDEIHLHSFSVVQQTVHEASSVVPVMSVFIAISVFSALLFFLHRLVRQQSGTVETANFDFRTLSCRLTSQSRATVSKADEALRKLKEVYLSARTSACLRFRAVGQFGDIQPSEEELQNISADTFNCFESSCESTDALPPLL